MPPAFTGIAFGGIFSLGLILDEKTLVPVGTIGAVCAVVWWLGRRLQRFEDCFESLERGQKALKEGQDVIHSRIDRLPCKGGRCEAAK